MLVTASRSNGIIKNNGVIIAVSGYDAKDHLVCEVSVVNQTDRRINVLPNDFYLTFRDKRGKFGYEFPLPAEKLPKKYQSRAKRGNFFRAFAAGMATTTYETSEAGTFNVSGSNGASATGIYNGTSRTTVPSVSATRNAAEANRRVTGAANEKGAALINASLRANTLFPKTYMSGMVYFERKKSQVSILYVMVDGIGYLFNFNSLK